MTATGNPATTAQLKELFEKPSLDGMLALDWPDFEDFVQYVFENAGYAVEKVAPRPKNHVDLVLHAGTVEGRILARVEVRRYRTATIIKGRVLQFYGAIMAKGHAPGFIVTTSDFTKPAYQAASEAHGKVGLLNGEHLLRYIRYVSGTRLTGDEADGATIRQPLLPPNGLLEADGIKRRNALTSTVITIANNKGGVAKTTTTLNLAFALAQERVDKKGEKRRDRVLVVDMDGQASITAALTDTDEVPSATLLDFFTHERALNGLIQKTRFDRVWLLPSNGDRLFRLDIGSEKRQAAELAFVRAIHDSTLTTPDGQPFDWILFDTPASQNFLTRIALASSHYVLLPATAETQAAHGANRAIATIKTMQALMGNGVELAGGVVTRWKKSAQADQAITGLVDFLRNNGSRLFETRIPEDAAIERAYEKMFGHRVMDIFHLGRQPGPAAKAYEALMKEVLTYVHRN
jgi:chromosome partitioning protein